MNTTNGSYARFIEYPYFKEHKCKVDVSTSLDRVYRQHIIAGECLKP